LTIAAADGIETAAEPPEPEAEIEAEFRDVMAASPRGVLEVELEPRAMGAEALMACSAPADESVRRCERGDPEVLAIEATVEPGACELARR